MVFRKYKVAYGHKGRMSKKFFFERSAERWCMDYVGPGHATDDAIIFVYDYALGAWVKRTTYFTQCT